MTHLSKVERKSGMYNTVRYLLDSKTNRWRFEFGNSFRYFRGNVIAVQIINIIQWENEIIHWYKFYYHSTILLSLRRFETNRITIKIREETTNEIKSLILPIILYNCWHFYIDFIVVSRDHHTSLWSFAKAAGTL